MRFFIKVHAVRSCIRGRSVSLTPKQPRKNETPYIYINIYFKIFSFKESDTQPFIILRTGRDFYIRPHKEDTLPCIS